MYFSRVPADCIDNSGTDRPSDRLVEVKGRQKLDFGAQNRVTESVREAAKACGGFGKSQTNLIKWRCLTERSGSSKSQISRLVIRMQMYD